MKKFISFLLGVAFGAFVVLLICAYNLEVYDISATESGEVVKIKVLFLNNFYYYEY